MFVALQDLKFDVDRLRREQESAARMISAHEKRMKQEREKQKEEIGSYQRKLEEAQDMNEHLRREQFLKQQTADKVLILFVVFCAASLAVVSK